MAVAPFPACLRSRCNDPNRRSLSDPAIWRKSRIPTGDMGASRNRSCLVGSTLTVPGVAETWHTLLHHSIACRFTAAVYREVTSGLATIWAERRRASFNDYCFPIQSSRHKAVYSHPSAKSAERWGTRPDWLVKQRSGFGWM
jgi:hypothetical protein